MIGTRQAAVIGQAHDLFAYPDRATAFMDRFEKEHPEAAAWFVEQMGRGYDVAVAEQTAQVPPIFERLPQEPWIAAVEVLKGE